MKLKPFTYFKDKLGLIYCFREIKPNGASAVLVYCPDDKGEYYQESVGYRKFVSHGLSYEWPYAQRELPKTPYEVLRSRARLDNKSGEEYLFVPLEEIVEIYSPHETLFNILNNKIALSYPEGYQKIHRTISMFKKNIQLQSIGLYGSLQCGVYKYSGNMNDIDLLIEGIDNYDSVVRLSRGNAVNTKLFPPQISSNRVRALVAKRRGQLSQFRITGFENTVCDVRILRKTDDINSYSLIPPDLDIVEEITINGALVIDAHESLSLPTCYKVEWRGAVFDVVSKHYHYLGAATTGDRVNVKGALARDSLIFIKDPVNHYIFSENTP